MANKKEVQAIDENNELLETSDILKFHDNPIESAAEDLLGRSKFAKHLANSILNWNKEESLVIAIDSNWGAGKSSVINMAVEELKKVGDDETAKVAFHQTNKNQRSSTGKTTEELKELSKNVAIIKFNPWGFSDGNNLGEHFFAEISNQLEKTKDADFTNIAQKLRSYGAVISPAISAASLFFGIPHGTLATADKLAKLTVAGATAVTENAKSHNNSEKEIREELCKELRATKKKILIVIDDIDRLTTPEIRQILRLIRVNGDFPHITYLLAFDRYVVETNLGKSPGVVGKDYLDKIVQVSIELPPINYNDIIEFLNREIKEVIGSFSIEEQKDFVNLHYGRYSHWNNISNGCFKDFFQNIRHVKRFINVFNYNLSYIIERDTISVNFMEFAVIQAIKLFAPTLYSAIRDNKELFILVEGANINQDMLDMTKVAAEQAIKDAINNKELSENMHDKFLILLKILFPRVDAAFDSENVPLGSDEFLSLEGGKRICSNDFFDKYFIL